MRTLALVACVLPRSVALKLGDLFARVVWGLYRLTPVRDFVPGNIATAFPQWDEARVLRTGSDSLALLTRCIVEIMRFPLWRREADAIVELAGREHLDAALAGGNGAIIATLHYGNWELMGASLARHFAPLAVLVQTPSKDAFAQLFAEYRRLVGVETYSNSGPQALRPVLRALRRGELVALVCDQHGEAQEGAADFFAHKIWVPMGPFTLSRRTGAPIVPARIVRGPGDRHRLEFGPPIPVADDPNANAGQLARVFESWIRELPDHWLWPHNRFERAEPPDGGIEAWQRKLLAPGKPDTGAGGVATALALSGALMLACLSWGLSWEPNGALTWAAPAAAVSKPVIVAMPDRLQVLDTGHPDTYGAIPLPGRAEAALYLRNQQVLVVHMPGAGAMSLVDLKEFSPNRYQAFQTIRAPELAAYDLGIEEIAGKVLLGYAKTAIAVLDIGTWKLELGFDRPESIPFPFSTAKVLYLPPGVFTLKDGQVTFEDLRRNYMGHAATPRSLPLRHQPKAMVAGPVGRHLYIAQGSQNGKGALADIDTDTRNVVREITTPGPLTSVVWVDDRTLAVLSGHNLGLVDIHKWKLTNWFRMNLPGGTPQRLLPAHTPRSQQPREPQ